MKTCYNRIYLEMTVIDHVNDLEMAWQDRAQHRDCPPLQRLGQHGVVRVRASSHNYVPSLKNQNSHLDVVSILYEKWKSMMTI